MKEVEIDENEIGIILHQRLVCKYSRPTYVDALLSDIMTCADYDTLLAFYNDSEYFYRFVDRVNTFSDTESLTVCVEDALKELQWKVDSLQ